MSMDEYITEYIREGLEYLGQGGWSTWDRGVEVLGTGGLEYLHEYG